MSLTLDFGKHKGSSVEAVPAGYLRWLIESSIALKYGIESDLVLELERRGEPLPSLISVAAGSIGIGAYATTTTGASLGFGGYGMSTSGGLTMGTTTAASLLASLGASMSPVKKSTPSKEKETPKPTAKATAPSHSCWELATEVMRSGFHVLLYGGIGLGKTTFALQAGLGESEGAYGLTLTDGMTLGDMFGRFWLKSGTSEWVDGPATRAMRGGNRLVLNEVEAASGEIMTALHALTDHPSIAMVALPNGEILKPTPGFRVVMTSNFTPSESLPAPLVDRAICIAIDSPHPASVAALPEDLRTAAMASSVEANAARRVSMRAWHHFASLRDASGEDLAARAVFATRAADILQAFAIRRGPKA